MSEPVIRDAGSWAQQLAHRTARARGGAAFQFGQITAVDLIGGVTVNLGGVDRAATRLLATPVTVGDTVLVLRQGADTIVLGPLATSDLPAGGTVALVPANSWTIRVTTSIGAVDATFPATYTPTVGDTVLLAWVGTQAVALPQGKTGTPAGPVSRPRPTTPPAPPAAATTGRTTFTAMNSGTWRVGDGWRGDANGNVIQGTAPGFPGLNNGAWFYRGKIRASLAGRTVTAAQIWLGRTQGGNYGPQTVTIYRVTQAVKPAGNVTYDTSRSLSVPISVGDRGWYTLPTAIAQDLVNLGGSLGVQAASPYIRLLGVANSSQAGAVRITWRT